MSATARDIQRFLERVCLSPELPTARLWAVARLRPLMEQHMVERGVLWLEAPPYPRVLDTASVLEPALQNPNVLLMELEPGSSTRGVGGQGRKQQHTFSQCLA